MVWIRCHCGKRRLVRPGQHTCSRRCGAVSVKMRNGNAWHVQNGIKAGLASGRAQADRTIAKWQQRFPGIPEEAIVAIRAQGYTAGYNMGRRAGWRQALNEAKQSQDDKITRMKRAAVGARWDRARDRAAEGRTDVQTGI